MCSGLVERYRRAGEASPQVLYADRDCCSAAEKGKAAAMFSEWGQLIVRLDVWHFMRRFGVGVTKDSHPLYGRLHETHQYLHLRIGCFRCGEAKGGQAVDRLPAHRQRTDKALPPPHSWNPGDYAANLEAA